jgi:hypothetical protein
MFSLEPTHLLILLVMLAATVLWILAIVSIARAPGLTTTERVIWILVVLILPLLGSIGWFVFGRRAAMGSAG